MENDKTIIRLLSGILIGGFLLASGGLALANSTSSSSDSSAATPPAAECKMPGRGGPGGAATLDSSALSKFVESGVITQNEADALLTYMQKIETDRKAQWDAMKNMTAAERQAQMEARKNMTEEERQAQRAEKPGPFAGAVEQGIITSEQAQTIQDTLRDEARQAAQTQLETKLAELVTAGTIDQSQADAILTYQQALDEDRKVVTEEDKAARQAEMEKLKAMTESERKAYMEQNRPEKPQPLKKLVDNGTLTQDQADAVAKIMGGFGGHGHGMGGPDHGDRGGRPTTTDSSGA